ncbi:adenylate/guanylate cyclase domain-containing protein [Hyalangium versicolor]|uniref:adenylate/guanylate cyclase domain-containing protein n=1 Tax=Hyalangium versicolor TaxID=2861190 RepID=UPI001CCCCDDA|nr:adenylate/guanylate cyclase domain-containing protein [Hyalangium versicolor]
MIHRIWTTRRPGLDTTVARFAMAGRANQQGVIAKGALQGERAVSVVRLIMIGLLALSQAKIARLFGEEVIRDPRLAWMGRVYVLMAIISCIVLFRQKPSVWRARWMPIPTALMDHGFLVALTWRTYKLDGGFDGAMFAACSAVMLTFSVLRYSALHVLLSTVLASAGYVLLAWATGNHSAGRVSFVLGSYIALGLLLAWTNRQMHGMFLELRGLDNLTRFLPPQVAQRLVKQGETSLMPVQREVTILFSDIRDFTTLSETLPPQQVLKLLDDYFGHMTQIVMAREGMVNKFLGDGMLACWGVPEHTEDHAEQAMRAALDMRAKLVELNAWREQQGEPPLRIGIGLHTGIVAAGMLGGAQQHEYTIIGDAVNVASRVEGLTKVLGVDILVSESTWRRGGARFQGELMGEERVKGRQEAVVLYSLKGRDAAPMAVLPEARTGT